MRVPVTVPLLLLLAAVAWGCPGLEFGPSKEATDVCCTTADGEGAVPEDDILD